MTTKIFIALTFFIGERGNGLTNANARLLDGRTSGALAAPLQLRLIVAAVLAVPTSDGRNTGTINVEDAELEEIRNGEMEKWRWRWRRESRGLSGVGGPILADRGATYMLLCEESVKLRVFVSGDRFEDGLRATTLMESQIERAHGRIRCDA